MKSEDINRESTFCLKSFIQCHSNRDALLVKLELLSHGMQYDAKSVIPFFIFCLTRTHGEEQGQNNAVTEKDTSHGSTSVQVIVYPGLNCIEYPAEENEVVVVTI